MGTGVDLQINGLLSLHCLDNYCAKRKPDVRDVQNLKSGFLSTDGVQVGTIKWKGVTSVGTKVYAAPYLAPGVLVLDTATDAMSRRALALIVIMK